MKLQEKRKNNVLNMHKIIYFVY